MYPGPTIVGSGNFLLSLIRCFLETLWSHSVALGQAGEHLKLD